jgi:hypothetical protein
MGTGPFRYEPHIACCGGAQSVPGVNRAGPKAAAEFRPRSPRRRGRSPHRRSHAANTCGEPSRPRPPYRLGRVLDAAVVAGRCHEAAGHHLDRGGSKAPQFERGQRRRRMEASHGPCRHRRSQEGIPVVHPDPGRGGHGGADRDDAGAVPGGAGRPPAGHTSWRPTSGWYRGRRARARSSTVAGSRGPATPG